jgi:hypothetical protein
VSDRLGHITRMTHMDTVIDRKADNCTEVTSDSTPLSEITLLTLDCACSLYRRPNRRVPHTPDFLCSFVGSQNFLRLSLKKGAHAVLSRAAYRKFGASRSFFARCGIPQASPQPCCGRHKNKAFLGHQA